MAKNKCPRNHNIHVGERLPERISRVDDLEVYKENLAKVTGEKDMAGVGGTKKIILEELNAKQKTAPSKKPDSVKPGDLVYVGGHIEEVDEVLNEEDMTVQIRSFKVGGCRLLPDYVQKAWARAKKEMGI